MISRLRRATKRSLLAGALALAAAVAPAGSAWVAAATASAKVQPGSGPPGQALVATYLFKGQGTCSRGEVTWTFGSILWTTSGTGGIPPNCGSSTPPTPPPANLAPGSYKVCGTDATVSPSAACAGYTITAPKASPSPKPGASPSPAPSPSPGPSPSPSPSPTPAVSPEPTPSTSPAAGGSLSLEPGRPSGGPVGPPGWPWADLAVIVLLLMAVAFASRRRLFDWWSARGVPGLAEAATRVTYRSTALPPPDAPPNQTEEER